MPAVPTGAPRAPLQTGARRAILDAVIRAGCPGLLLAMAGCATVAPYERETLSRRDMALDRNEALVASEAHGTETREGVRGGFGGGGGGCGCN